MFKTKPIQFRDCWASKGNGDGSVVEIAADQLEKAKEPYIVIKMQDAEHGIIQAAKKLKDETKEPTREAIAKILQDEDAISSVECSIHPNNAAIMAMAIIELLAEAGDDLAIKLQDVIYQHRKK